jgi:hypothetical protein
MDIGNAKSKLIYEKRIPACYRIPKLGDPSILLEQFIRAKYDKKEFSGTQMPSYSESQNYSCMHCGLIDEKNTSIISSIGKVRGIFDEEGKRR